MGLHGLIFHQTVYEFSYKPSILNRGFVLYFGIHTNTYGIQKFQNDLISRFKMAVIKLYFEGIFLNIPKQCHQLFNSLVMSSF